MVGTRIHKHKHCHWWMAEHAEITDLADLLGRFALLVPARADPHLTQLGVALQTLQADTAVTTQCHTG